MEERRKGRCQQCGEWVDDDGWYGHTVAVADNDGNPMPAPCGPVDWEERRKGEWDSTTVCRRDGGERRVTGPMRDEHNRVWRKPDYWKPWNAQNWYNWREDRRRSERRKGE